MSLEAGCAVPLETAWRGAVANVTARASARLSALPTPALAAPAAVALAVWRTTNVATGLAGARWSGRRCLAPLASGRWWV
jgi:hypothetical protein